MPKLQNTQSEVVFLRWAGAESSWSGGGRFVVDDMDDWIDGERDDAEHEDGI